MQLAEEIEPALQNQPFDTGNYEDEYPEDVQVAGQDEKRRAARGLSAGQAGEWLATRGRTGLVRIRLWRLLLPLYSSFQEKLHNN